MTSGCKDMTIPPGNQKTSGLSITTASNYKMSPNIGAETSFSLFDLPPEIRFMVWQLLLPGRRVLRVRPQHESSPQTARLAFEGQPGQPIVSQICQESRDFTLRRGAFIFKTGSDGGFWWSADEDVLLVDQNCDLGSLSYALEGLCGLNAIQHIAVDSYQAVALNWYKQEPREAATGVQADSEGAYTVRWVLSWGRVSGPCSKHPLLRFFPHFRRLTVHFAQPFHDPIHSGPSCDLLGDCSFTFGVPAEDMETAIRTFEEFHRKWIGLPGGSDPHEFRWRRGSVYPNSQIPSNSTEFCRKPSFEDGGDYNAKEWACAHILIWTLHHRRIRRRN